MRRLLAEWWVSGEMFINTKQKKQMSHSHVEPAKPVKQPKAHLTVWLGSYVKYIFFKSLSVYNSSLDQKLLRHSWALQEELHYSKLKDDKNTSV